MAKLFPLETYDAETKTVSVRHLKIDEFPPIVGISIDLSDRGRRFLEDARRYPGAGITLQIDVAVRNIPD